MLLVLENYQEVLCKDRVLGVCRILVKSFPFSVFYFLFSKSKYGDEELNVFVTNITTEINFIPTFLKE